MTSERRASCNEAADESQKGNASILAITLVIVIASALIAYHDKWKSQQIPDPCPQYDLTQSQQCYHTCSIEMVESVPQNLTILSDKVKSTFEAWNELVSQSEISLDIAAYKSSLRGKHVLGSVTQDFSVEGDLIFEELKQAGLGRNVNIRIVENAPSKDKGDNEDARSLQNAGVAALRKLNLQRLYNSGTMHSKFIIADEKSFYLGSANLDWRSLSQKMEMGVLVKNCPCLAKELRHSFEQYWQAANVERPDQMKKAIHRRSPHIYNMKKPLKIQYDGVDSKVYIATSPKLMNAPERTWDLDALVDTINRSKTHLHIHVMDYFPMFLYSNNNRFWPVLDNALRDAILRGVNVKMIAAALHYPKMGLRFLKSLEMMNEIGKGKIEVKIIKIPTPGQMQSVIRRERRTHKKFVVTDDTVVVGTSNWSGDYFEGVGTGAAIVIQQQPGHQPLIQKMRNIFKRDWESEAAHPLSDYITGCIDKTSKVDFCEYEKDKSLLINSE
ncbi:unnamed protein product [Bursaphelenchus xylophilus]|uniref:(pine wood nematode) hypothetical protein n=1 Tax=Bursaphelenchus xylophilus TaxID=6326 RepID=A0A1I7SQ36_BURXY|nr:unnamed protein product [Bursaphelenchus xylophilus]CAG9109563.1 unnamed protein product [Bursaphelenchus xylophilus]